MKWIKVSKEKPKHWGVYLATNGDDIQICGYWHFGWGSIERDAPFKPTHWMPLPTPPTAELAEGANTSTNSASAEICPCWNGITGHCNSNGKLRT